MRSDRMKKGLERAPHRSLCKAMGYTDEEISRPIIGIANSANEVIPGHMHLNEISSAVKMGIAMSGGTPMEFSTIGLCDGIAMGHEGMKYSLISRELIADSVEIMAIQIRLIITQTMRLPRPFGPRNDIVVGLLRHCIPRNDRW